MKKSLLFILVTLFLVSCESSIPEELTTKQIVNLVVNENDWIESTDANDLNRYYSYSLNMPEISTYKYNKGAVIAYLDKDNVQQTLPTVRHFENGAGNRWTETVDYEYSPGSITFYVTSSDFAKIRPAQMYFKVILLW